MVEGGGGWMAVMRRGCGRCAGGRAEDVWALLLCLVAWRQWAMS